MKKNYLYILLFFCFSLVSCFDDDAIEYNITKYNGKWLWLKTVGGFGPTLSTPKEGETIKISFDDHLSEFSISRNDTTKVTAKFKVEKAEDGRDKISYTNVATWDYYFNSEPNYTQIKTDTLEIWDGMIDGYFSFYKKID
ncbi:MAG: hypothetical protein WCS69_11840 [Ignavibacteriaceae bacterium]|jgi:hypothetical protein